MPANYDFTQSSYKQLIIRNLHTFLIFISILSEYWDILLKDIVPQKINNSRYK
jgi:hypothetical protein